MSWDLKIVFIYTKPNESRKYTYYNGELKFYYDDELHLSKVSQIHADTILLKDEHGSTILAFCRLR